MPTCLLSGKSGTMEDTDWVPCQRSQLVACATESSWPQSTREQGHMLIKPLRLCRVCGKSYKFNIQLLPPTHSTLRSSNSTSSFKSLNMSDLSDEDHVPNTASQKGKKGKAIHEYTIKTALKAPRSTTYSAQSLYSNFSVLLEWHMFHQCIFRSNCGW